MTSWVKDAMARVAENGPPAHEDIIPTPKERQHLPPPVDDRVGRGTGLYRIGRSGKLVMVDDRYEYVVDATDVERDGGYFGFVSLRDYWDPLSIEGAWCSCPDHGKVQWAGFGFCKHTMWAALMAVNGHYERLVQAEIIYNHHNNTLWGVKFNGLPLRRAKRDALRETVVWLREEGFKNVPCGHGLLLNKFEWPGDEELVSRVYTRL